MQDSSSFFSSFFPNQNLRPDYASFSKYFFHRPSEKMRYRALHMLLDVVQAVFRKSGLKKFSSCRRRAQAKSRSKSCEVGGVAGSGVARGGLVMWSWSSRDSTVRGEVGGVDSRHVKTIEGLPNDMSTEKLIFGIYI